MSRIRLTNKTRLANDPADMQGDRQDCGKRTRFEKYKTKFDPAKDDVGGRDKKETDGSTLYEGDKKLRNDMHVTEIKLRQAKLWERSKLATKLAMYLLGEKAPQSMIKAQASEFLSLGNQKLAKAVSRFAKTEYLYATQEEAPKAEEAAEAPAQEEAPKAEEAAEEQEQKNDEVAVCEDCGKEECACGGDVASEQEEACTAEEQEQEVQAGEDEIEDEVLASLFESNSDTLVANKKSAKTAKKVGVQKFEQPQSSRVASKKISLDQLWEGAPDLSKIF